MYYTYITIYRVYIYIYIYIYINKYFNNIQISNVPIIYNVDYINLNINTLYMNIVFNIYI